ncbi:magnesium/cobalt transporter CorA [Calidifontibacter sp. DB0510]|uniref:Magnesium transport protein CorA n=1 Tax=Metallococcus carri TaxID=1656884 RepID=A0A967B3T6_9MICO|nr:magnesium/cobalt transporter CorA [Metallococcus carri]NHN56755.1 magnesium/cobalt transporter CorA [Metallococcus carri]NOP37868.1 magnesium/cobalt transporter CorA [Calidifontibacter sp. DB2511S]
MPSWRGRGINPTWVLSPRAPSAPEHALQPSREEPERPAEATVVERAIYRDGRKLENPHTIREAIRRLTDEKVHDTRTMAWIGMAHPNARQIQEMAHTFDLHPLAVEDAIVAHQRPKIERYGNTLFVVLRAAAYDDATETVNFGEIHLFVGPDFVVTVRHSDQPELRPVRQRLEADPDLLALGPEAVLYGVLDHIVDGYAPVVAGLENDIDEIETQVFESDPQVSRRIYELSREVMELQRATRPVKVIIDSLTHGFEKYGTAEELQNNLRDVADHAESVVERVDGFRQALTDILTLNATLVAQTQNEEMKRMAELAHVQGEQVKKASSWAAILFTPTVIAGIYGMNFERMPELAWRYGYGFALLLMFTVSTTMYIVFRRKNWL